MSARKVIYGTLTGLAVGAIAGMLFAPFKGSMTRKKVKDKGDDYLEELKSRFDEFLDSMSDNYESAKKNAVDPAEKGKSHVKV